MLYGINEKQNLNGWTEERFDELRATYLAMVSRFDHQLGMIKEKLRETGFTMRQTSLFSVTMETILVTTRSLKSPKLF